MLILFYRSLWNLNTNLGQSTLLPLSSVVILDNVCLKNQGAAFVQSRFRMRLVDDSCQLVRNIYPGASCLLPHGCSRCLDVVVQDLCRDEPVELYLLKYLFFHVLPYQTGRSKISITKSSKRIAWRSAVCDSSKLFPPNNQHFKWCYLLTTLKNRPFQLPWEELSFYDMVDQNLITTTTTTFNDVRHYFLLQLLYIHTDHCSYSYF